MIYIVVSYRVQIKQFVGKTPILSHYSVTCFFTWQLQWNSPAGSAFWYEYEEHDPFYTLTKYSKLLVSRETPHMTSGGLVITANTYIWISTSDKMWGEKTENVSTKNLKMYLPKWNEAIKTKLNKRKYTPQQAFM